MKAFARSVYGSLDVLELKEVAKPMPRTTRCWYGFARHP